MPEIISRDDAQQQGRARFYTGVACPRGHVAERYVSNGGCVACVNRQRQPGPDPARHKNALPLVLALSAHVPKPSDPRVIGELAMHLSDIADNWLLARNAAQAPVIVPDGIGDLTPEQQAAARREEEIDHALRTLEPTDKMLGSGLGFHIMIRAGWTCATLIEHGYARALA